MRLRVRPILALLSAALFLSATSLASAQRADAETQAAGLSRAATARAFGQAHIQAQIKNLPVAERDVVLPARASDAARADVARTLSAEPRVQRARKLKVDPVGLRDLMGTAPLRITSGEVSRDVRQHVLPLFDDVSVRLVKLDQRRDDLGNTVWTGGVIDDPQGSATIVVSGDTMTAHIVTEGRTLDIVAERDGTHTVREMKPRTDTVSGEAEHGDTDAKVPPIDPADVSPVPVAPETPERAREEGPERAQASTNLRILIAYTPKAAARISNMSATASMMMSHLNTTLSNSQIDVAATLVGLEQVNYTEGTSGDQVLDDATNGAGDFARIQQMRAATQADLVAVVADYGNASCGIAWINDTLDRISNLRNYVRYGVSLTNAIGGCIPGTFTHEVGHNLGANHDRYVVDNDQPGPTRYNYGYVDTAARFMDVMAYSNQCSAAGVRCTEVLYYSTPELAYNGRPIGVPISQPDAAHNAQRIREIAPRVAMFHTFLTSANSPTLSVMLNGSGTVTSQPAGINCGATCGVTFASGTTVTLTAVPARGQQFAGWQGACSGTGTCTVNLTASTTVTAVFERGYRYSWMYASNQVGSQSFLRIANTGSTPGTATVYLSDFGTGDIIGAWTSPSVPARASLQIPVTAIETGLYPGTPRPAIYAASVRSQMSGFTQYVVYRPVNGTLENLSTCDAGTGINPTHLANVHSSLLNSNFPSTIAITNSGTSAGSAQLGIYDALNGTRLATYNSASIPAGGQAVVTVEAMEVAAGFRPNSSQYHYVVRIENGFTGALQHLVNNMQIGAIIDMSTVCALGVGTPPTSSATTRRSGPIFASYPGAPQSFLRFFNTGTTAGSVTVGLNNYITGQRLATWTSPSIPAGAAVQYAIGLPEAAIPPGTPRPSFYSTSIQTQIAGTMQHVLYKADRATLTNASTCDAGVTSSTTALHGVHTSLMDAASFPSAIIVSNSSTSPASVTLALHDANNGVRIGGYTTPQIAPLGQVFLPVAAIENAMGINPRNYNIYHYNVRVEGAFNGHLQHVVTNGLAGILVDMSATCALPVRTN